MSDAKYGRYFVFKTLVRAAFAAVVLGAAAAHAQPPSSPATHHSANQGGDYNWMAGGGGN